MLVLNHNNLINKIDIKYKSNIPKIWSDSSDSWSNKYDFKAFKFEILDRILK